MKTSRKLLSGALIMAGAMLAAPMAQAANTFPDKPITIVVPFPPGGTSDVMGRTMAKGMTEKLGVPVVVDNKGGGGTLIGSQYVARSKPDGYTLLLAATPHAINPSLYKNIPYDTKKDFRTVSYLSEMPLILAVSKDSKINDFDGLIEEIKKDDLTYGSSGVGGSPHLATELFLNSIDGDAIHVPYKGSNPSVMDLVANRTDFAFDTLYLIMTQVDAGQLKPIAQTGNERHPRIPDVPTIKESGYPDYEVTSWFSIAAPGDTPDDVIEVLNKAMNETLKDKETVDFLSSQGMIITGGSADDAQARLLREIDSWTQAVEASGAQMD